MPKVIFILPNLVTMAKKEMKVVVSSLLQVNNFIFLLETTKD